jgi:hypothetical protein
MIDKIESVMNNSNACNNKIPIFELAFDSNELKVSYNTIETASFTFINININFTILSPKTK